MSERKRRKWDVAAPQGIPLHGNRAGIGMSGSSGAGTSAGGVVMTAQGPQTIPSPVQQAPSPQSVPSPAAAAQVAKPIDKDTIARAQLGAAAIVAKLNQELAAQGKLPPGRVMSFAKPGEDGPIIFRDVYINDAPPDMRHHMTKRPTQDDVARRTGTQVVTRGRYMAPGTPFTDVDKPLHLHITPGACSSEDEVEQRRCVEQAASDLRQILGGKRLPRGGVYAPGGAQLGMGGPPQGFQQPRGPGIPGGAPFNPYNVPPPGMAPAGGPPGNYGPPPGNNGPPPGNYGPPPGNFGLPPPQPDMPAVPGVQSTSLFLGFEAAPDFNVVLRLKGPNGSYMQHIATETGVNITLRGKGSGIQETDALHVFVSSGIPKSFSEAVKLAQNLIDTVKSEHDKQFPYYQPPPPQPALYAPPPGPQMQRPPYSGAGYPPPGAGQYPPSQYNAPPGDHFRPPGAVAAPPPPGNYGPPQQMGQRPPYMQGGPQQQQYGPPSHAGAFAPPPDKAGPAPTSGMGPSGGPPGTFAQREDQNRQEEQRRKRFREFKEEKPASARLQPPPYYAPPPDVQPKHEPVSFNLLKQEGNMGPPPPRTNGASAMGPPPPKQPQNSTGVTTNATGGLGGLVDYGDDD